MDKDADLRAANKLIDALGDVIRKAKMTMPKCKFCKSENVVRNGKRSGTQYWLCKNCGRGFVDNQAIPRGRFPVGVISRALYNYYAGMSLNSIAEGIRQETGDTVSNTAIYNWLTKYTNIALDEAAKYEPKVGRKWVMDETIVKLDGKKWWLITTIDQDTRYLIAAKLSPNRCGKDIWETLETAKAKTGVVPTEILTDGWSGYPDAIDRAYGPKSKHIRSMPFTDAEFSTNLMERWNGTLKDRLKPMRGMDRNSNLQLILDGFIFYYNYLRPHSGLKGKTPAEAARVEYPFKSWGDIVDSQTPKVELTKEDRLKYRLDRKRR